MRATGAYFFAAALLPQRRAAVYATGSVCVPAWHPPKTEVERGLVMEESHNVYLTADGIQKLREELDYLITVRRPEIAHQIADAKADGDISENAGYDEAKTTQAFVEGRILTLKNILSNAKLINENGGSKGMVELGRTVTIRDRESDEEEKYTIVDSTEVDPLNGRISLRSPIGHALMGHKIGDTVEVQTPNGSIEFEIVKIA
jgi:transcription elongation factor GreA